MSEPITKGSKRSASRPASAKAVKKGRQRTTERAARRLKASAPRRKAEKAPVKKAAKTGRVIEKKTARTSRSAQLKKPQTKKAARSTQKAQAVRAKKTASSTNARVRPTVSAEGAALRAFERAHKEFSRGRFAEARDLFRTLIEQHANVPEVAARARTYLAIAEARLRKDNHLPRDPEALYDRGVIELNRGQYMAAQEMFERALKRQPEAAHIHYGLAATRARLGSISSALESLERALNLQPSLRVRAQQDQDLAPLRNEPDFERLVFASR
ncbi:MAG: hypothetical protein C4334_09885 [Pyrinomonas sp.]|uniref:TPR end-of-group domain-containing protein n=1 Tax=Pyrinomonas sp. TaxID=2080306 RepID=UPI0033261C4C